MLLWLNTVLSSEGNSTASNDCFRCFTNDLRNEQGAPGVNWNSVPAPSLALAQDGQSVKRKTAGFAKTSKI